MKNTLKINHVNRTIVMDRTFAKLAANTMTPEYEHLQVVRRDYPYYTVVRRQIKKNTTKESYRGLTYEYMEDYIMSHGTVEEIKERLKTFDELRLISECHSKSRRYPVIKRWFLEQYPEIVQFGMDGATIVEVGNVSEGAPLLEITRRELEPAV